MRQIVAMREGEGFSWYAIAARLSARAFARKLAGNGRRTGFVGPSLQRNERMPKC